MRYIVAMDSFKGCLTADDACKAARLGIIAADPSASVKMIPLADGGEGTADAVVSAMHGRTFECEITDPFGDTAKGSYGIVGDSPDDTDALAVIDTASASGITLARNHGLDIMNANTYGTGKQIRDMLDLGYRKILIGLGGSGTNDGGTSALYALGAKFFDADGHELTKLGGGMLGKITRIDLSGVDGRLKTAALRLIYDVSIPLTGSKGCSINYSRQKGADDDGVAILESGMCSYANTIKRSLGIDANSIPGAGAAGGLGCGLALIGGIPVEGAPYILKLTEFEKHVRNCDCVITGEGKTDFQTENGKLPVAVAASAKKHGKTVICVCGMASPTPTLYKMGIDAVFSIANGPITFAASLKNAASLIEATCFNVANLLKRYGN